MVSADRNRWALRFGILPAGGIVVRLTACARLVGLGAGRVLRLAVFPKAMTRAGVPMEAGQPEPIGFTSVSVMTPRAFSSDAVS